MDAVTGHAVILGSVFVEEEGAEVAVGDGFVVGEWLDALVESCDIGTGGGAWEFSAREGAEKEDFSFGEIYFKPSYDAFRASSCFFSGVSCSDVVNADHEDKVGGFEVTEEAVLEAVKHVLAAITREAEAECFVLGEPLGHAAVFVTGETLRDGVAEEDNFGFGIGFGLGFEVIEGLPPGSAPSGAASVFGGGLGMGGRAGIASISAEKETKERSDG